MPQCTDSLGPVMALGPDRKLGIIRDTTIQPFRPKQEEMEIPITQGVKEVDINVTFSYETRPGDPIPIYRVKKTLSVYGLFPHQEE